MSLTLTARSLKSILMNRRHLPPGVGAIKVWGPNGMREAIVDESVLLAASAHQWRWIGGRVVSISNEDDFSTMLDLAEMATGVRGACPSDPKSMDYRSRMLCVPDWPTDGDR